MKRHTTFNLFIAIITIGLIMTFQIKDEDKKKIFPFENLSEEQVVSVKTEYGTYPAYTLLPEEKSDLLNALQKVVIFQEYVGDRKDWVGIQHKMFYINLSDGESFSISANNPFFIIDDMWYEAEYESCDEISQIYEKYSEKIRAMENPSVLHRRRTDCISPNSSHVLSIYSSNSS